MGFKVLFIQQSDDLRLYLDNLKVKTEIDEILFPISDLMMLIIDNYKTVLSVQLINKLTENNVTVILCGLDHLPATVMLANNGYHASSGQMMKQLTWEDRIKNELRKEIVKAKIKNQLSVLKFVNGSNEVISLLQAYYEGVEIGDRTNREGLAAKVYFRELFGSEFIRFEKDIVNAGLDYGYAIFRSLIATIIVSKGLLPNLGIFHIGKTNRFNLADDIIEPYRPIVDFYVYKNILGKSNFTETDRKELIKLTTYKVRIKGLKQQINNSINLFLDSILKCIDEDSVTMFEHPEVLEDYDL